MLESHLISVALHCWLTQLLEDSTRVVEENLERLLDEGSRYVDVRLVLSLWKDVCQRSGGKKKSVFRERIELTASCIHASAPISSP